MSDTAIVSAIGFASLIVGYFYKAYVDARNRRWDLEDRAVRQATTLEASRVIAIEAVAAAAEVAAQLNVHDRWEQDERRETNELLKSSVAHAKAAYKEANDVNKKIASLGMQAQSTPRED
jgi:hypothetical protein